MLEEKDMKYDSVQKFNSVENYILQMRPILRKRALFSDGTSDYRIPAEPKAGEHVKLRFRTAADNVDLVVLCHEDERIEMQIADRESDFDYYEDEVQVGNEPYKYHFEIVSGMLRCSYDRAGVSREYRPQYEFCIVPGFSTPEWSKGAVMYQIFTDRFYNGDKSNDVKTGEYYYINRQTKQVENWDKCPEDFDVANFYGGDLQGVLDKMDYLEELGVEVIYFNPLFVSASSHKYDTQDYDYIDPHFGVIVEDGGEPLPEWCNDNSQASLYKARVTNKKNLEASNELFIKLVEEAHRRGMRVILDGVFNHCGSFNKWLDREKIYDDAADFEPGAFATKDSPYHSYFHFQNDDAFPNNVTYEGWWGHDTLPKLNYEESPELEEYVLGVAKKWVSPPYNADGWRLDVAADLGHSQEYNHQFWKKFRKAVKEANPEALILAEHYGDPKEWLRGDQWDSVMNYDAFMEPLTWFLTGMEKHSDEYKDYMLGNIENFENAMTHYMASFGTPSLQCAMNQLSNHDHSRFLTRTNHKVGRAVNLGTQAASEGINRGVMKEAVVVQMTWPGAPTLYYGDEAGLCGFTDPDNRRTYPWGKEDKMLIRFHRDMIRIHRENPAFCTGSVKFLHGDRNILCYTRFNREQQFIIVINNDGYTRSIEVGVCGAGVPKSCQLTQIMYSTEDNYSMAPVAYQVEESYLNLTLPKYSAVILRHLTGED